MHPHRRTNQHHFEAGFTLIEIMLVLTLISILYSMATPSLRGFAASTRLKSSARAIRDMLNFARDMAITERTAYLVVFNLDGDRYWLASSETFDVEDPTTSSLSSSSSTVRSSAFQQTDGASIAETGETTLSRTSTILGVPQELSHSVSLSRITTNHNFQSNQVDSGVDYIYFSPIGSSEDTVLYIQDRRGKAMSIAVESATGRVRLQALDNQQREELGLSTDSN
ncbi:MAG: prepilin-type N-terminal cleavage/methylation domain-containing protein [Candidatus Poribacteria bacterium]|nr:prepilin-type N-terminal cleavage/methylation domain-containing protein [Candidatus Poribacteria bacterium]